MASRACIGVVAGKVQYSDAIPPSVLASGVGSAEDHAFIIGDYEMSQRIWAVSALDLPVPPRKTKSTLSSAQPFPGVVSLLIFRSIPPPIAAAKLCMVNAVRVALGVNSSLFHQLCASLIFTSGILLPAVVRVLILTLSFILSAQPFSPTITCMLALLIVHQKHACRCAYVVRPALNTEFIRHLDAYSNT